MAAIQGAALQRLIFKTFTQNLFRTRANILITQRVTPVNVTVI